MVKMEPKGCKTIKFSGLARRGKYFLVHSIYMCAFFWPGYLWLESGYFDPAPREAVPQPSPFQNQHRPSPRLPFSWPPCGTALCRLLSLRGPLLLCLVVRITDCCLVVDERTGSVLCPKATTEATTDRTLQSLMGRPASHSSSETFPASSLTRAKNDDHECWRGTLLWTSGTMHRTAVADDPFLTPPPGVGFQTFFFGKIRNDLDLK